jgi:hypothetical protein
MRRQETREGGLRAQSTQQGKGKDNSAFSAHL